MSKPTTYGLKRRKCSNISEITRLNHKFQISEQTSQKGHLNLYLLYTYISKVEIFHVLVLHNKVAMLTRKLSERGTRYRHERIFRKVLTIYISI